MIAVKVSNPRSSTVARNSEIWGLTCLVDLALAYIERRCDEVNRGPSFFAANAESGGQQRGFGPQVMIAEFIGRPRAGEEV